MEKGRPTRSHRVGAVTFGVVLILFGVLFLARIFLPELPYQYIFRLWPLMFIFLGIEALVGNHRTAKAFSEGETVNFVYDKTAIFLTVCLVFFAMVLGALDYAMQLEGWYAMRF